MMERWIDVNCMIGRSNSPAFLTGRTTAEIKEELLRIGIAGAFVYHAFAKQYHPLEGNQRLIDEIGNDPFFKPVWVWLPSGTGELPSANALHALFSARRLAGIRLFPSADAHRFSLADWCMGEVYRVLEFMRLPLFLELEQTDWETVHRLVSTHPELKLVLTGVGYRHARNFTPILLKYPNIYLEVSMYKNFMGVEFLTERFGSERLLFGTGMPVFSAGACKYMIETAKLSENDLANIAYRNSERLTEDIRYA